MINTIKENMQSCFIRQASEKVRCPVYSGRRFNGSVSRSRSRDAESLLRGKERIFPVDEGLSYQGYNKGI